MIHLHKKSFSLYLGIITILLAACGAKATSTAVPTALPSATYTPLPTLTSYGRVSDPTPTNTPQPTVTPTPTPTATFTPQPTSTPTPLPPTATPTATATATPTLDLPTQVEPDKVFFTAGRSLFSMDLDGRNLTAIVTQETGLIEYLAVDPVHNKLYLSSGDDAKIYMIDLLNVGNKEVFSNHPGWGAQGLAIDPTGKKMYLGFYYDGLYVMDMNKVGQWTQLVDSASLDPLHGQRGQLQLDPTNSHIYFRTAYNYDCDMCRYIWRVDFDGNNLIKIIPYSGGDALDLDLNERKMYFSDVYDSRLGEGSYSVYRANLDGSGLETVLAIPAPFRYCRSVVLDVVHQKMYMNLINPDNGNKGRAIARSNMDGTGFEILYQITGVTEQEVAGGIALIAMPITTTQTPALTVTATPTHTPAPTGTATPTHTPTIQVCGANWTRLGAGKYAIVAPGSPNRVRSEPKKGDNLIASLTTGTVVKLLEGPVCADGLIFWKVENGDIPGGVGWTAEGDGKEYWLEPYKP
jgi:hypothetical protein